MRCLHTRHAALRADIRERIVVPPPSNESRTVIPRLPLLTTEQPLINAVTEMFATRSIFICHPFPAVGESRSFPFTLRSI